MEAGEENPTAVLWFLLAQIDVGPQQECVEQQWPQIHKLPMEIIISSLWGLPSPSIFYCDKARKTIYQKEGERTEKMALIFNIWICFFALWVL